MSELPSFEIGEKLQGFPGGRMRQLVEATAQALRDSSEEHEAQRQALQALCSPHQLSAKVLSTHASALEPFGVLGFADLPNGVASLDEAVAQSKEMVIEGETPATAHGSQIVILQDGCAQDDVVQGVFVGLTPVRVDITSLSHEKAALEDGNATRLASGSEGFDIWWKETTSTGEQWCIVLLGGGGGASTPATSDHSHRPCVFTTSITGATFNNGATPKTWTPGTAKARLTTPWDAGNQRWSVLDGVGSIAFVDSTTDAESSSAGKRLTYPSMSVGDLIVIWTYGYSNDTNNRSETPTGYTQQLSEFDATSGVWLECFTRFVDGTESTFVDVVADASGNKSGAAMAIYSGVIGVADAGATSGSDTGPGVTTEGEDALVLSAAIALESGWVSSGAGTTRFDEAAVGGAGTGSVDFRSTYQTQASAGAFAAETWDHDNPIAVFGVIALTVDERIDVRNPSSRAVTLPPDKGLLGSVRYDESDGIYVIEWKDCVGDVVDYTE